MRPNIESFFDELEKIAYGEKEHKFLQGKTMEGMGATRPSWGASEVMKGNVRADVSPLTHPHAPLTSKYHALGARNIGEGRLPGYRMRGNAIRDLADTATAKEPGFLQKVRGAAAYRDLGLAQHTAVDPYAHVGKAPRMGEKAEDVMRAIPGGRKAYGGAQHALSAAPGREYVDTWNPANRMDRTASEAAEAFGYSTTEQLENELMKRGLKPEQARIRANELLTQQGKPSRAIRAGGRALRWGRRLARMVV